MKEKKNINIWDQDLKKKTGGFEVPANYFEDVEDEILNKIKAIPVTNKSKTIPLKSWMVYGMTIAASILILIFVWQNNGDFTSLDSWTELEWDQMAVFEESWILEELGDDVEDESYEEIDFLLAQGVTNDEILEVFKETTSIEE